MSGLIDPLVTNFDNGITNEAVGRLFGSMGMLNPLKHHVFFHDFDQFVNTDTTGTPTNTTGWDVAPLSTGIVGFNQNDDGGVIQMQTAAVDNDNIFVYNFNNGFLFETGKRMFYQCRFATPDVVQTDILMGLSDGQETITPLDGIFFLKSDGANSVILRYTVNNTSIDTPVITTMSNSTFVTLGWMFDGQDRVYFGVDGNVSGFLDIAANNFSLIPVMLAADMGLQAGEAVGKILDVDYVFMAKER